MGLAASQARFLGITARKANCEFKSTRLAQERLQLTDQLTAASQEYSAALNSTKLVWKNDACTQDYKVNYNLLMMPSAANDYNPYFVTTKSGAIILNSKYIAAAEAAGITMTGGVASQEGRDKFVAALVPSGLITQETADAINITNYVYEIDEDNKKDLAVKLVSDDSKTDAKLNIQGIFWEKDAGLGKEPLSTTVYDALTLADLIMDKDIGKQKIDWLQLYKGLANEGVTDGNYYVTEQEYNSKITMYEQNTSNAIATFLNMKDPTNPTEPLYKELIPSGITEEDVPDYVNSMVNGFKDEVKQKNNETPTNPHNINDPALKSLYDAYNLMNKSGLTQSQKDTYRQNYNNLVNGIDANGNQLDKDGHIITTGITLADDEQTRKEKQAAYDKKVKMAQLYYGIRAAALEEQMYKDGNGGKILKWGTTTNLENPAAGATSQDKTISFDDVFNLKDELNQETKVKGYTDNDGVKANYTMFDLNVIKDGIILSSEGAIKSISIANLLKDNIIIYAKDNFSDTGDHDGEKQRSEKYNSIENVRSAAVTILEYVAKALGYGSIGTGINVDESTNAALTQAFMMTQKIFLNANNAVTANNDQKNKNNDLYADSAYENAVNYNRIGSNDDKNRAAVNLSSMISAFLTYYDNALRGADSQYVVGRGNDDSNKSKTYFVTDDKSYTYVAIPEEQVEYNERMSNFYDELYNNLCAYGYRRDDMVEDDEYLQSAIKDGRYALMSLNLDGYYYQTRYADTGYLVEEKDQDAITKAEADYTQKKARITYKEEVLDMRTKNLDAEIAELNAEMNSVQNLITKAIEKTFQMFQGGS